MPAGGKRKRRSRSPSRSRRNSPRSTRQDKVARQAAKAVDSGSVSPSPHDRPTSGCSVSGSAANIPRSASLPIRAFQDEPWLATSEDEMEHVVESAAYIEPALALKAESVLHPDVVRFFKEKAVSYAQKTFRKLLKDAPVLSIAQLQQIATDIVMQTPSAAMSTQDVDQLVLELHVKAKDTSATEDEEYKSGSLKSARIDQDESKLEPAEADSVAVELAEYLNAVNDKILAEGDGFDADSFTEIIDSLKVDDVVMVLNLTVLDYDENVVRRILGELTQYEDVETAPPSRESSADGKRTFRHPVPPPDFTNICGQPLKDRNKEWFAEDNDRVYIYFEHRWTGADGKPRVYKQRDETRVYRNTPAIELLPNETDSEVVHTGTIRTFDKSDTGVWKLCEKNWKDGKNDALGEWKRFYDVPPRDKSRAEAEAEPKLVARKYHRVTGAYLGLYKMGKSWGEFEKKAEAFDINNRTIVGHYNRWINQIRERFDYRHVKRPERSCWSAEELTILRNHFNDLIEKQGLISAHQNPNWKELMKKVAKAGKERNEDSVASMAERDIFVQENERMGTHEWREFGRCLLGLQKANPDLVIPKNVLYPGRPIPMEKIEAKKSGGTPSKEYWNPRKQHKRELKLTAKIVDNEVVAEDMFKGRVVKKWGLMAHAGGDSKQEGAMVRVATDGATQQEIETGQEVEVEVEAPMPEEGSA